MSSSYNMWGLPDDKGDYESMLGMLGPKKPIVNPYGSLNPEQVQLTKALGPQLTASATAPYSDYLYNGQLTAPMSGNESNIVDNSARFNAVANNTFNRLGTYDPNQVNADYNSEVQDPTMDNFKRNIEPLLGEELPSFGTARANVVARSLGDLQNNLLQNRFTAQQTAKTTALNAIAGQGTYDQSAYQIAQMPRLIQQAGLDSQYQNFLNANQQKQTSLQNALSFLGLSTGTFYQPQSEGATLIDAAKTGAQLAAAGGGG